MAYEIQVSATNFTITSSSTEYNVTVSSPATANFTITNNLSTVTITKLNTTASIYTDAVELVLANLNDFWRGTWSAASTYTRGDIVDYQYSQYFLSNFNVDPLAIYGPSATPPNQDSNWILFNWHEAPFAVLTVTNTATFNSNVNIGGNLTVAKDLTVGGGAGGNGLVINSTATFNGQTFFNNSSTFNGTATFNAGIVLPNSDLEVSQVIVNGKNNLRTKTTGTSTLRVGITDNDLFTNSPAFNLYTNGTIQGTARDGIIDTVGNTKEFLRGGYTVNKTRNNNGIDNVLILNTYSSRLVAQASYPGSSGDEDPSQRLYRYGDVNKYFGGGTQEIVAGSQGGGTLTNYIYMTSDGIINRSYSLFVSAPDVTSTIPSQIVQNQNSISLQLIPKYQVSYPIPVDPPDQDLRPFGLFQLNRKIEFAGTTPFTEIRTTASIHLFTTNGLSGGSFDGFLFAPRLPAPTEAGYTPNARMAWATFTESSGYPQWQRGVMDAQWGGSTGTDYVSFQPTNLYLNPTTLRIGAGTVNLTTASQILLGGGGLTYSNNTVQTVAWEGYDQGTVASSIPKLQLRRGALSQIQSYTPAQGELVYSTNTNKLYVGDGVTAGGILVSGSDVSNQALYTTSSVTFANINISNTATFANTVTMNSQVNITGPLIIDSAYFVINNGGINFASNRIADITTTATQLLHTFDSSIYKGSKYLVQAFDNNEIHFVEMSIICDGTNVWKTEYGINTSDGPLITCSVGVNGNLCELYINAISPTNMTVRAFGTLMAP